MNRRDPEYDRFGPWVIEISDEDPPPPLFIPHLDRTESPLLAVKIPRKVARREAHPGMDLYDYLVSLYEDDMVVLERVERLVRARTIRYRDVRFLRMRNDLLRGSVHLGVEGQPYDLPYNTVSSEIMRRLVGVIRERYQGDPKPEPLALVSAEPGELSFYFERLLRDEQEGVSGMQPVAAQADTALGTLEEGLARRIPLRPGGQAAAGVAAPLRRPRAEDRRPRAALCLSLAIGLRQGRDLDPAGQHHGRRLGLGSGRGGSGHGRPAHQRR